MFVQGGGGGGGLYMYPYLTALHGRDSDVLQHLLQTCIMHLCVCGCFGLTCALDC